LLTALSVLGVSKKYCQKGTDALLKSRAKTSNARAPHDVLRREAVLDEHAITQNGMRRVSTVQQLDEEQAGDGNSAGSTTIEMTNLESQNTNVDTAVPRLPPRPSRPNQRQSSVETMQREIDSLKKTVARLMKHMKLTSDGEVKVDAPSPDATSISIKDTSPTKMHRNPHWNKLKKSVKAANAFKASSGHKNKRRTKRLSTVMKSRRNSATTQQHSL
jgi:hypothetical protein